MGTDLRADIRRRIEALTSSLASELEALVERHAVLLVVEQLGVGSGAAPTRARRAMPAPKGNNGDRILAYVKAHPGARSEHVRAALGVSKGAWVYALGALINDKKITRRGVKRASTLHPR